MPRVHIQIDTCYIYPLSPPPLVMTYFFMLTSYKHTVVVLVNEMYVTDDLPQYSDSPSEPLGQDNVRDS